MQLPWAHSNYSVLLPTSSAHPPSCRVGARLRRALCDAFFAEADPETGGGVSVRGVPLRPPPLLSKVSPFAVYYGSWSNATVRRARAMYRLVGDWATGCTAA